VSPAKRKGLTTSKKKVETQAWRITNAKKSKKLETLLTNSMNIGGKNE